MASRPPPVWNVAKLDDRMESSRSSKFSRGMSRLNQLARDLEKPLETVSILDTLDAGLAAADQNDASSSKASALQAAFTNRELQRDFDTLTGINERIATVMHYTPADVSILTFQFQQGHTVARRLARLIDPCTVAQNTGARTGDSDGDRPPPSSHLSPMDRVQLKHRLLPLAAFMNNGQKRSALVAEIRGLALLGKPLYRSMKHVVTREFVPEWKKHELRRSAARLVQQWAREQLHRKAATRHRAASAGATKIQRLVRAHAYRGSIARAFARQRRVRAALSIQRALRAHRWRVQAAVNTWRRQAARRIQANARGFRVRISWRKYHVSRRIQASARGYLARIALEKKREQVELCQSAVRAHLARQHKHVEAASQLIQALTRVVLATVHMSDNKKAATQIQATCRRVRAQRWYRNEVRFNLESACATTINSAVRQTTARRRYALQREATCEVQVWWKACQSRQHAAQHIQRVYRGHADRDRALTKKIEICGSLQVLQAAARGLLARMAFDLQRRAALVVQKQQRGYRSYKAFSRQKRLAAVIQPIVRGAQHRQRAFQLSRRRNAATQLQTVFRGFRARKSWRPWLTGGEKSFAALFRSTYFNHQTQQPQQQRYSAAANAFDPGTKMSPVAVIRQRRKLRTESLPGPNKQAVHTIQKNGEDVEARAKPSSFKQGEECSRSSDDEDDDSYDDSFDEFEEGGNASSSSSSSELTAAQSQADDNVGLGTGDDTTPKLGSSQTVSPKDGRNLYYPGTTRKRPSSVDGQQSCRFQTSSTVVHGSQTLSEESTPVLSTVEKGSRAQKSRRPRRSSAASKAPGHTVADDARKRRSKPRKLTVAAWKGQSHLEGYDSDDLLDEEDMNFERGRDGNGGKSSSSEDAWAATALRVRLAASSSGGGGEAGIAMATNRRTQLWFGDGSTGTGRGGGLKAGTHLVTGLDALGGGQSMEVPKAGTMPWQRIMMSASRNAYRKRRPPR